MPKTVVVALGGNTFIADATHQSVPDQYAAAERACRHLLPLLRDPDVRLVVTHGNGPQVGFILLRSEIAAAALHQVPLDSCVADTQGALGYQLERALRNEIRRCGLSPNASCARRAVPNRFVTIGKSAPVTFRNTRAGPPAAITRRWISAASWTGSTGASM